MELIETKTLGVAAASIEFTSIPQDGTDLLILASLRSSRANAIEGLLIAFNGSTSNFSAKNLEGQTTSVGSGNFGVGRAGVLSAANATANTFANQTFYIPNYSGSTNKTYSLDSVSENNATTSFATFQEITGGLWSQTAAITSVRFTPDLGTNLVAGSTISLYKITKGSSGGVTVS